MLFKKHQILFIASGELGISGDTVDKALNELDEIGYVTLYRKGGEISKIEERIPLLEDQYSQIGEKWLGSSPTEIERATVESNICLRNGHKDMKKGKKIDS